MAVILSFNRMKIFRTDALRCLLAIGVTILYSQISVVAVSVRLAQNNDSRKNVSCEDALKHVPAIKVGMRDSAVLDLLGEPNERLKNEWVYNFMACATRPRVGEQKVLGLDIFFNERVVKKIGYATIDATGPAPAATRNELQTEQKWERYTGKGENFTVSLPERPSAFTTYRPVRFIDPQHEENYRGTLYGTYSEGVAYLIYSFPRHSEPLKQFIDEFTSRYSTAIEIVSAQDIIDGVLGKQHVIKFKDLDGVLDFYVTDNRAYILEVIGGDESNPSIKRFIESFTFGKATDSEVIGIKPNANKSSPADSPQDAGPIFTTGEVTRRAVIVLRQEPQYTEEARQDKVSGRVVIKAVLSATGKVTNIVVTKSLPRGLTEKAIEVARQMIFIPAMKDGRFVSQTIQVEYNFSVY
jgi:TonB family protein